MCVLRYLIDAPLDFPQSCLGSFQMVASFWDSIQTFCELQLENHKPSIPKARFDSGKIKLPHSAESLVIEPLDFVSMQSEGCLHARSVSA